MLYHSNRMHDAVVSKLIATSRGSPCNSMASCTCMSTLTRVLALYGAVQRSSNPLPSPTIIAYNWILRNSGEDVRSGNERVGDETGQRKETKESKEDGVAIRSS